MKWPWTRKPLSKQPKPEAYKIETSWALNGELVLELKKCVNDDKVINGFVYPGWRYDTVASTGISEFHQIQTDEDFDKFETIVYEIKLRMINAIIRLRKRIDPMLNRSDRNFKINEATTKALEELGV